jgi:hypothetical protein
VPSRCSGYILLHPKLSEKLEFPKNQCHVKAEKLSQIHRRVKEKRFGSRDLPLSPLSSRDSDSMPNTGSLKNLRGLRMQAQKGMEKGGSTPSSPVPQKSPVQKKMAQVSKKMDWLYSMISARSR